MSHAKILFVDRKVDNRNRQSCERYDNDDRNDDRDTSYNSYSIAHALSARFLMPFCFLNVLLCLFSIGKCCIDVMIDLD